MQCWQGKGLRMTQELHVVHTFSCNVRRSGFLSSSHSLTLLKFHFFFFFCYFDYLIFSPSLSLCHLSALSYFPPLLHPSLPLFWKAGYLFFLILVKGNPKATQINLSKKFQFPRVFCHYFGVFFMSLYSSHKVGLAGFILFF